MISPSKQHNLSEVPSRAQSRISVAKILPLPNLSWNRHL